MPPKQPPKSKSHTRTNQTAARVTTTRAVTPKEVHKYLKSWHQGGKEAFTELLKKFNFAIPNARKIMLQTISDLSPHDRVEALKIIQDKMTEEDRQVYTNLFRNK